MHPHAFHIETRWHETTSTIRVKSNQTSRIAEALVEIWKWMTHQAKKNIHTHTLHIDSIIPTIGILRLNAWQPRIKVGSNEPVTSEPSGKTRRNLKQNMIEERGFSKSETWKWSSAQRGLRNRCSTKVPSKPRNGTECSARLHLPHTSILVAIDTNDSRDARIFEFLMEYFGTLIV